MAPTTTLLPTFDEPISTHASEAEVRKEKRREKRRKGGGDHPSMDILKMWMKEVEEVVEENMPPRDDSGGDDGDDGDTFLDESCGYLAAPPMQITYSNVSSDSSFNGQYDTTQAFDYSLSMNDAILPPSAPLQSTYDSVSMQLFEQHFDAGQLDTLNALDDEPSPFINPVLFFFPERWPAVICWSRWI
jgi:hypothetical protein